MGAVELHFLDGERIADDVLDQRLQVFALIGQNAATAVQVEAGMFPAAQHPGVFSGVAVVDDVVENPPDDMQN